jgi:hypothetical protein
MAICVHDWHIPASRTLHLVDIENLCGGPYASSELLQRTIDGYQQALAAGLGDALHLSSNQVTGVGLRWEGVVCHLAAFAK